jgi:hypothetical protein
MRTIKIINTVIRIVQFVAVAAVAVMFARAIRIIFFLLQE